MYASTINSIVRSNNKLYLEPQGLHSESTILESPGMYSFMDVLVVQHIMLKSLHPL